MSVPFTQHKPGSSKQQNKSYKGGKHRSKGDLKRASGRVEQAAPRAGPKQVSLQGSKHARRLKARQMQTEKRQAAMAARRLGHLDDGPPRVVVPSPPTLP